VTSLTCSQEVTGSNTGTIILADESYQSSVNMVMTVSIPCPQNSPP